MKDEFQLPFTPQSTWLSIQSECSDLRQTQAYLNRVRDRQKVD